MFPSEMVILMAIAVTRDSGVKLRNQPMDIVGEYVGYLYDSLVRRGFFKWDKLQGYQLTTKGQKAVCQFLNENETRFQDTIDILRQMGIESSQKIVQLETEFINQSTAGN